MYHGFNKDVKALCRAPVYAKITVNGGKGASLCYTT